MLLFQRWKLISPFFINIRNASNSRLPSNSSTFTSIDPKTSESESAASISNPKESKPAERIKISLKDEDILEQFVRGGGPGGQSVNTSSNKVQLTHIPTGIQVQAQPTRSLASNRSAARKLLMDKLDQHFNGSMSKTAQKIKKIQQQKAKQQRRAAKKYGKPPPDS